MQSASTAALIVAAGRGMRVGGPRPKQYALLAGKPVLRWSVEAYLRAPLVNQVCVVIHPDDHALYQAAVGDLPLAPPVLGAETRQGSVRLGLEALRPHCFSHVLVHDAARPLIDQDCIAQVAAALARHPGVVAGVALTDTLKFAPDLAIVRTVARADLWRAQTPQGFHFAPLLAAHLAHADAAVTDDAALAELAGIPCVMAPGHPTNIKLTTPEDFAMAEAFVAQRFQDVRVGSGFDVHAFAPGDHVWLCGVRVPHSQGLAGHSDADVGLHALTDALLGALGAGDIGVHFPPSDPQWRGQSSDLFLRHAGRMVAARQGLIAHLDVTLICEAPKVGPHREAMRQRIAEILSLDVARVSVKATTTEKLGFTGRREGIAAQAVATVRLPL